MQITVLEPVKITGFFNRFENGNLHRSQSILNESRKFLFSQKGMYTRYLLKYFGVFTVFIDRAIIGFQKRRLINHGNTTGIQCSSSSNSSRTDSNGLPRLQQPSGNLPRDSLGHWEFPQSHWSHP